jgi:glycosyltransferase involved in cell wall biosynthesis
MQVESHARHLYTRLLSDGVIRMILAISPASFLETQILGLAEKNDIRIHIPSPVNAFDQELLKCKTSAERRPMAVIFGRLIPEKGALDLLRIWKTVESKCPEAVLEIMGPFANKRQVDVFLASTEQLGLRNVVVLGNLLSQEEVWRQVAGARLLIYPSYVDAYSLTVLESLALGLAVVAYDIPAIKSVYSSLRAVARVKPGDMASMAEIAVHILRMSDEEFNGLHDECLDEFLHLHDSWASFARAEYSCIKELIANDN